MVWTTSARPQQNGHNESFNGRLRDELLNETLFRSLPHARAVVASLRSVPARGVASDRASSYVRWHGNRA